MNKMGKKSYFSPKKITRDAKLLFTSLVACEIVNFTQPLVKTNADSNISSEVVKPKTDYVSDKTKTSSKNDIGSSILSKDTTNPSDIKSDLEHHSYESGSFNRYVLSDFGEAINSDFKIFSSNGGSDNHSDEGIHKDILSDRGGFDGKGGGSSDDSSERWTYTVFDHYHNNHVRFASDNSKYFSDYSDASDGVGDSDDYIDWSFSDNVLTLRTNNYSPHTSDQYNGAIRTVKYILTNTHDDDKVLVFRPVYVENVRGHSFKVSARTMLNRPLILHQKKNKLHMKNSQ